MVPNMCKFLYERNHGFRGVFNIRGDGIVKVPSYGRSLTFFGIPSNVPRIPFFSHLRTPVPLLPGSGPPPCLPNQAWILETWTFTYVTWVAKYVGKKP